MKSRECLTAELLKVLGEQIFPDSKNVAVLVIILEVLFDIRDLLKQPGDS